MFDYKLIYVSTSPSFFFTFLFGLIQKSSLKFSKLYFISNFSRSSDNDVLTKFGEVLNLSLSRNPFSFRNIIALMEFRKILKQSSDSLIHTQTPISSALVRIAKLNSAQIIYSAHGFHFNAKSSVA
jgi:hypothetical protein